MSQLIDQTAQATSEQVAASLALVDELRERVNECQRLIANQQHEYGEDGLRDARYERKLVDLLGMMDLTLRELFGTLEPVRRSKPDSVPEDVGGGGKLAGDDPPPSRGYTTGRSGPPTPGQPANNSYTCPHCGNRVRVSKY